MKKLLLLFAVLLTSVGAWAQEDCLYQKIPHTQWGVSAFNEAGVSGNEGGVAFLKDENASTFYHSKYNEGYEGGTNGKDKGNDGVQGFLITLPETYSFDRITYKGRSNGEANWATKVRIYVYETLPTGLPEDLSTLTYAQKETFFNLTNGTLSANPTFENSESPWANDTNIKTIDFSTPQSGKYVLFIADECTGGNGYFTCSDIHLWQKVEGVEQDIPYFLKIDGLDDNYLDTRVGVDDGDNNENKTISKTTEKVATYFTLTDGYWHISSLPGNEFKFVQVIDWDAVPGCSQPSNWTLHKDGNGKWYLAQSTYYASTSNTNHYLGANGGNISGNSLVFTDKAENEAVKFELIELTVEELAVEEVRAAEGRVNAAKEIAQQVLGKIGVGYPAPGSEPRATLQAAIDNEEATVEGIYNAIDAYNADTDVVLPEAGKVYRLVSASPTFSDKKVVYSDNTELKWQSKNEASMNQLWTVESINGMNLSLMNVGDAAYSQVSGFSNPVRTLPIKNESSLTFLGKGQFRVMCNKQQSMHANGNGNGANASGNIINSNAGIDSYSAWYFEEVAVTKNILSKQIESLKTAYIGSLLVKQESVADLETAVDAAQAVCDAEGDYANAFATLVASVNNTTIEYIDLGYFRMISKEGGKYAYNDNTSLRATTEKNSPKAIFKLTKANNGTFYVQNGNGYYAQGVSQSQIVNTAASVHEYVITRLASGHYVLRPRNSTTVRGFWHQDGSSNVVGWSTDGGNTQWTFEPLSEEELAKIYTVDFYSDGSETVTYNNESYTGDKTVKADGGFYVLDATPESSNFNIGGVESPKQSACVVEGKNIVAQAGYANASNLYIIRCKKGNSYARYNSSVMSGENNMLTYQNACVPEGLFYIEAGSGNYQGFYTIRPVCAPNLYVYNLGTANADSKVATKAAPDGGVLDGNYYWKITKFGTEAGNITPYNPAVNEDGTPGASGDNFGWNRRGGDGTHIGYWQGNNTTDDNLWYIRTIEEEFVLPSYTDDDSKLGLATYASVAPMPKHKEILTSKGFSHLQNATYDVVKPKVGSFYRLRNTDSGKYMIGNEGNAAISNEEGVSSSALSVFYVDESDALLSYNAGRYLNSNGKCLSDVGTVYTGTFKKAYGGYKEGELTYSSNGSWIHGSGDNLNKGDSDPNGTGYNWTFEPVTSLPFTFNSKALGFATFCAPVNVEIPNDVTAYIAEIQGNTLKMRKFVVEDDENLILPAETPVMLYKADYLTEATIELLIVGGEYTLSDEDKAKNNFFGTIAAETYPEGETVYSLQTNSTSTMVGFYQKSSETTLGGFKAWIKTATSNARTFTIIFDGDDATGLKEALGLENENVEIYDLSGRRLDKPAKGVNVIGGKLVIK